MKYFFILSVPFVLISRVHAMDVDDMCAHLIDYTIYEASKAGDCAYIKNNLPFSSLIPYTDQDGKTALHVAAEKEFTDIVEFLTQFPEFNVNDPDSYGENPLHLAAHLSKTTSVQLLLTKNIQINALNNNGRTALYTAAHYASNPFRNDKSIIDSIIMKLIDAGISIHTKDKNRNSALTIYPFVQTIADNLKEKLFKAIAHKDIVQVKKLLRQIPFSTKDTQNNTLLHLAVNSGDKDMVGLIYLLKPELIAMENNNHETPVSLAVAHLPIFNLFIELAKQKPSWCTII